MPAAEAPLPVLETDVAIVGSGGAGLMCALHVAAAEPRLSVTIVSKGAVGRSGCTRMVQGGFNAVLGEGDSVDAHFRDTLEGGQYLNDQELAWTLVNDAPRVIHELEEQFGCLFDRTAAGDLDLKPFGGQSFDRTVHRADQTGLEIMGRLRDQVLRIGARELEDWRALDLLFDQHGDLSGLTMLDLRTGLAAVLLARVVVVATGGSATMYRIAAPAREKTGDGMAMCWRARARAPRHGDAPVPSDRARRGNVGADRRGARGGTPWSRRAPDQQARRAVHGALRPDPARALDP